MRYICKICGYVYDEAKEKTPFDSLPETWKCPLCGAAKSDFEPEKEKTSAAKPGHAGSGTMGAGAVSAVGVGADTIGAGAVIDWKGMSPGQLAALCSNLARGCEKQYKAEEAALFGELADYFAAITPPVADASVEYVAALLENDINFYSDVRAAADEAADRGAARVCVWGEKVTRMLASHIGRYQKEGEAMLADTSVWVCSVCGFVYTGDDAPETCPVCKVPSWKFEKIEGRT